jgi:hypothetical protein
LPPEDIILIIGRLPSERRSESSRGKSSTCSYHTVTAGPSLQAGTLSEASLRTTRLLQATGFINGVYRCRVKLGLHATLNNEEDHSGRNYMASYIR